MHPPGSWTLGRAQELGFCLVCGPPFIVWGFMSIPQLAEEADFNHGALHTVADLYPDTKVWGVDYWPHQMLWVPENLEFILDDVELEWLESTFDADRRLMYIHAREMVLAITDQSRFLDQAFRFESPFVSVWSL